MEQNHDIHACDTRQMITEPPILFSKFSEVGDGGGDPAIYCRDCDAEMNGNLNAALWQKYATTSNHVKSHKAQFLAPARRGYSIRFRAVRITGKGESANSGPPQDVTVETGADYAKQDKKKMSFFNPLDPLPKYEFYAKDTWTGRVKNTRPSLDVLRTPQGDEDLPPPLEDDGRPKVKLVRFGWVLGVMIISGGTSKTIYNYSSKYKITLKLTSFE
ncbi:hypothetical protein E1301_Tti015660 [Triplophysa tibetana]|uniref:Amino acid permease N-terminal domain-containing protein n=1 Tax=Triplophysa tibetana TaxID=1572043 RepID=A0A5A9PMD7_9TELE|nr:hypothetical protein E1301_Tti015660 [Triplophysa tibetana]